MPEIGPTCRHPTSHLPSSHIWREAPRMLTSRWLERQCHWPPRITQDPEDGVRVRRRNCGGVAAYTSERREERCNRDGSKSVQVGRNIDCGQIQRVATHRARNTTTSTTLQPRQSSQVESQIRQGSGSSLQPSSFPIVFPVPPPRSGPCQTSGNLHGSRSFRSYHIWPLAGRCMLDILPLSAH